MNKIIISRSKMTVTMNGAQIEFSKREFDLLYFLANNLGKALSRKQIIDAAWDHEFVVDRTVDIHIMKLRKKIGDVTVKMQDGSRNYKFLNTVKGVGYRLSSDLEIKVDDNITKNVGGVTKTKDDIIINGSYKDNKKNMVVVSNVADSKFGKLVIIVSAGTCNAMAIKDFKSVYKSV